MKTPPIISKIDTAVQNHFQFPEEATIIDVTQKPYRHSYCVIYDGTIGTHLKEYIERIKEVREAYTVNDEYEEDMMFIHLHDWAKEEHI